MADDISQEEYAKLIKEQCPFCKIASGEISSKKVYEDSRVLAFLDINPASLGHTLVIPKKHYTVLPQMSDADVAHITKVVKRLSGILFEIIQRSNPEKPAGVNVLQNNGAAAGQQVPHVHFHVIPRLEGDGLLPPWQPLKIEDSKLGEIQAMVASVMQKSQIPEETAQPVAPVQSMVMPQQPVEKKEKPKPVKPLKKKPRSP